MQRAVAKLLNEPLAQIKKIVALPSRREILPNVAESLATMREKVQLLVEGERQAVSANGVNQWGGFDMSNPPASGQGGNSRDYTLARLKRDRPDLAEMVIGGADLIPPIYRTRTVKMV